MPKPNNGDVVMKVSKACICGSDIHYWDLGTAVPYKPCGECPQCKSGNTQRCINIMGKSLGLSAAYPGGYSEYLKIYPEMVLKLPENVTDVEGAMVEPSAVALHGVNLANIHVGDHVLIIGAGIIGVLCAMFVKMRGASYVAVSETNELRRKKSS